jgi:hypothetical protein
MVKIDHTTCKTTTKTNLRMKFYKKIFACHSLEELINLALDNLHERSIQTPISFFPVHTYSGIVYSFPKKIEVVADSKKMIIIIP